MEIISAVAFDGRSVVRKTISNEMLNLVQHLIKVI
jgi:hypothetical protein